jgi:hypothetical protein
MIPGPEQSERRTLPRLTVAGAAASERIARSGNCRRPSPRGLATVLAADAVGVDSHRLTLIATHGSIPATKALEVKSRVVV